MLQPIVKVLVILPAVSVSVCQKRKLQTARLSIIYSHQDARHVGTNWLHLVSALGLCCSLLSKARLSSAELTRLAMSTSCLYLILFKTRIILTCFSCATAVVYDIEYKCKCLFLNGHSIGVTPTSSTGHPNHRAGGQSKQDALGYRRVYILKVYSILVWKFSYEIQYWVQRIYTNKFWLIIIKLAGKETSTRQYRQYSKGLGQGELQKGVKNCNHMTNYTCCFS